LFFLHVAAFARPRRGKRISWSSEDESGKITNEKNIAATSAYRTSLLHF